MEKLRICHKCGKRPVRAKSRYDCNSCHSKYMSSYYKNSPDKAYGPRRKRKQLVDSLKREAKKEPCADCGKKYPYYVMDFDHRGDKKFELATTGSRYPSVQSVKDEIAKCDVVCANCHRERTYQRGLV